VKHPFFVLPELPREERAREISQRMSTMVLDRVARRTAIGCALVMTEVPMVNVVAHPGTIREKTQRIAVGRTSGDANVATPAERGPSPTGKRRMPGGGPQAAKRWRKKPMPTRPAWR
jgi:hypothetical protein